MKKTREDEDNFQDLVSRFNRVIVQNFEYHFDKDLLTLKFHALDHLLECINRFSYILYLYASGYETFNL